MTDHTARPRRSALYMPGSKPRALEKARGLPADVLVLDLEDAVTPAEKAAARRTVAEAVRARAYGRREVVIRVNGLDTQWGGDDLAAAAACGPDAVLIPKVENASQLADAEARLERAGSPALWAMIETPRGVLHAADIAGASPRLACLVMGTNDLAAELRAVTTPDRAPLAAALQMTVLAARAHGLAVLDGVHNAFRDFEGLRAECGQGRALGFDGKTLIHPGQIGIANEVFGPTAEELETARRHVDAFAEAEAEGQGVAVVDGRIVENLHVASARRLLAQAEAIRAMEAEAG
ncbi:MAG TPA: CoA ester lyase [Paracoccaceae bacterium]|nr:CoA ester lyase [Paracoccaceae bacterium]